MLLRSHMLKRNLFIVNNLLVVNVSDALRLFLCHSNIVTRKNFNDTNLSTEIYDVYVHSIKPKRCNLLVFLSFFPLLFLFICFSLSALYYTYQIDTNYLFMFLCKCVNAKTNCFIRNCEDIVYFFSIIMDNFWDKIRLNTLRFFFLRFFFLHSNTKLIK